MSALGKPWLVDVRDLWIDASISLGYLEEGSRIERVSRQFQRTVLYRADRISVTTPSMRRLVCERYGEALEAKTVVLPNGVNTDEYAPRDESRSGQRSVSDAAEPRPTIIYTGNLGHAQDLESFVRAMAHLSSDDAVLKLVGSGDAESELKRLTAELGLDDRVEFVGLVERGRIAELINDAAVGVAPLKNSDELSYAMPTKVYEYLACGVPALVAGRGEIERFAERSGAAIHVENDPERIAEQLDELLADEMRREALGDDGRRYIESNYDRREIASMFDDQLTQIHSGVACSPPEVTREEVQA
jgi:glycosyltransferase involved in cell wall biosynthesis